MRRAARTDANQAAVVERFRQWGCSVQPLHQVGDGCPDLLVGVVGVNLLVEVKDGEKPPSERKLTKDQEVWHGEWKGQCAIVKDLDEVDRLVEKYRQRHARRYVDAIEPRQEGDG